MTKSSIYRVVFNEPPLADDDRREFFFTSLSAIYDTFTPEQVGCKPSRLWNIKVSQGQPYNGRLCQITKEEVTAKTQMRRSAALKSNG